MYNKIEQNCDICTGCGRCIGNQRKLQSNRHDDNESELLHVLTEHYECSVNEKCVHQKEYEQIIVVDIGTTTVAMQLFDCNGRVQDSYMAVNPQIEFGADVLSRITIASDLQKAKKMQRDIQQTIKKGLNQFRNQLISLEKTTMFLSANTTMVYLLMGYDTEELGRAPFLSTKTHSFWTEFASVSCFVFPGISAYLGGDVVAGMYACDMFQSSQITLLLDLGTNGEIVLGNKEKRLACATAAGPAFEGGASIGVWGADMMHFVAELISQGIVDETGLLSDPYFETGIRVGNVLVTQAAIRQLQLAKSAIGAGIQILLKEYGVGAEAIDKVILAGGLGYYLKAQDAVSIGLLPQEFASKTTSGGNTALAGTYRLGLKLSEDTNPEGVIRQLEENALKTQIISLVSREDFESLYLQNLELKRIKLG